MAQCNDIFVLEWDKKDNESEYKLTVTLHFSIESALKRVTNSKSKQHCISTINPNMKTI